MSPSRPRPLPRPRLLRTPDRPGPERRAPKPTGPTGLLAGLREDVRVTVARDPSIRSSWEALLHPALPALWAHRLAHPLHRRGHRIAARAIAYAARSVTGVEIHPGATLGRRVFIDHGAAVVIGETAVVGDDVTLYHQVTLGAVGWWTDNERPLGERRHPRLGDKVVVGAGASVLGPVTVGDGVVVGAGSMVTRDVPAGARVHAPHGTIRTPGAAPGGPTPGARELLRLTASAGSW